MGEKSDDPILHKVFILRTHFIGKDNGALQAQLQDNLAEQYEHLLVSLDDDFGIPEDFVEIIATTMADETSAHKNDIGLTNRDLLHLMEDNRVYKVGGVSSPDADMEWPKSQIP